MVNGRCEKCGEETESRREGSVQGLFCRSCGWRAVTTYIPAIYLDETEYEVRLCDADHHNRQHIKAVAQVSGQNFLAARELLQQHDPVVFRGKAPDVRRALDTLAAAGVGHRIAPPYPYTNLITTQANNAE